jgi:CHAT domain-containing protein/lipopolysaccharide biosynthesis regulator YciM
MFQQKEFIVFAISLILALLIFTGISSKNQTDSSSATSNPKVSQDKIQLLETSAEFKYYLDVIQNKRVDKSEIQSQLNSLQSGFEREYLLALLDKRSGNYEYSFQKLFSVLGKLLSHPAYYEELAVSAKVSDNLNKVSDWLSRNNEKSINPYYSYLEALIEYQTGQTSKGIEKLETLISNGMSTKEIYLQLANGYRIVGSYDEAFKYLLMSEKLCESEEPFLAKIINLKGTILFLSGEYDKAKLEYESALKNSRETGNKNEEIKSIANLAIIKDQYGEIFEARYDFVKAIEMAKDIENSELLAFLYSELGVSFTYTSNIIESRQNYERSLELYEQLKNNERLSYLSSNIGSLYLQISNYKSAFEYYKKGLSHAGENKLGKILNLTGLGDVYSNESNYTKALEYYSQAKAIADSIKDISSIIKINQGIGALYFNVNRPYEALETLRRTESETSGNESPFEEIKLYSKIGTVLTSVDSLTQAERYFYKAITLADNVGDIYSSILLKTELAHSFLLQGNYLVALKLLGEVQSISKSYELTQLLGVQELYKGKVYYAEENLDLSGISYDNAFKLSGSVNDYSNQIEAAYLLGKNFEEKSDYTSAENWYRNAIELIEKISSPLVPNQEIQIAHFSGVNSSYNSLAELYIKQGRGEEAFLLIDKARSRNTKSNLDRLKLLAHLSDESDYKQLIDLQWMTNSSLYDSTLKDSLQNILSDLTQNLSSKSVELKELLNPNYLSSLSEIQDNLQPNYNIISAYVGDDFITFFRLSSDSFNFKSLQISRDSLLTMLESVSPIYRSDLESQEIYINEDLFSFNALAAFKLYNSVFKDFIASIPKESNLIFSLPTELVKLPVEMLITEWKEGESPYFYADKNFLLEDYNISYTPSSIIFIAQNKKAETRGNRNLLIGDPYIMDSEYSLSVRSGLVELNPSSSRNISLFSLKYSKDEIKSIDQTIAGNLVFLSEEATETNFKNNVDGSNIIHISTHSFLIKDQPLILFANQNNGADDGFLELGEIIQLNLNSELVVLSSCRSGLGRIDEAEGIIGMQKAFFDAGSKSVLVSLWDVNDKYTSYFMKEFYKYLSEGKSKSDALRQAKLNFIKNHSANPYYWSAFVLSGNPASIKIEQASSFSLIQALLILLLLGGVYYLITKLQTKRSD